MRLLTATIQKSPRIVNTKFGQKLVCDCKLDDGQTVTLWQPETSKLINYGTGERISLTVDSKGKHHFVENGNDDAIATNQTTNKTSSNELSNSKKREIAEYVTTLTNLYGFCYKQTELIDSLPNEDRRAVATTLFLGAVKKFNLG